MSDQLPASADEVMAALRRTGTLPLRLGDPRRVGPYAPIAVLGSGGMGRVYLARLSDGSPGLVAVKVIRPEYAEDPRFRRRFEREAAVHARLRTPHAPRLCGTGFEDELLWMATEYLPGFDLADAVKEYGALAAAAVWRLVAELGHALAALAVEEIVHRDLKPSNVLLSVRGAHVIDFGISKAADASAITGTGNRVGTPAYMSPEHLREGTSDTASDVFSLGGTLVYAAAGRAPFGDGTGVDVMHRVAFEDPNPEVLGEITAADTDLGALLTACLAKEPAQRPTPQELIGAAAARALPSTWPEPLGAKMLARQRAYESLRHLAVVGMSPSPPPGDVPLLPSPSAVPLLPSPGHAPPSTPPARPATPDPQQPVEAESVVAPTPPAESGPVGAPGRSRRRASVVAVAALAICVLAATALLLDRQDAPSTATPRTGATSTDGSGPGDPSAASGSPGTSGMTRPDVDGAVAEDPDAQAVTTSSPEASPSVGAQPRDAVSTPGGTPSATPSSTPSADSPSTETDATPWLTQCTYYGGNGRTRLGDSGKRVQQVQCMLTKRGYSVGGSGVDGEFGSGTETAVQAFQSDRGLSADGVVGHDTWVALRSTE